MILFNKVHLLNKLFLNNFIRLKSAKNICFLLAMQFCAFHGMELTIPLTLKYPDGSSSERQWNQTDFNKISLFKAMFDDIGGDYSFSLNHDNSHVTHDYLKDLIKGGCTPYNVEQYVTDYVFFIGNDISLDTDGKHGPFKRSLKWQIFQEHKQFFYNAIHPNRAIRDFLYCDTSKESPFEQDNIIITQKVEVGLKGFTDNALKLSLCYPYIMHYQQIFQENPNVMFLEFNNCIIENLELKTLFEYFPNLHTLTINNCYVKEITSEDYSALLARLKTNPQKYLDKEILKLLKRNENEKIDINEIGIILQTINDQDATKKDFALKHNRYSFIIDFKGTTVINADDLIAKHGVTSRAPGKNKPILIQGLWHKNLIYQRLKLFAKPITLFVLASGLNIFFIQKLFLSSYKFSHPGLLPVLPILWIVMSCIIKPLIALALYESITSQPIVIR